MLKLITLSNIALIALCVACLVSCDRSHLPGDIIVDNGTKCIVIESDDNGNAVLVMSLDEVVDINADSAVVWAKEHGGEGWHLPNKQEIEKMKKYRSVINQTLEKKNLPKILVNHTFYWSSTECSPSHVYACGPNGVRCYFRSNQSYLYRARAVKSLR